MSKLTKLSFSLNNLINNAYIVYIYTYLFRMANFTSIINVHLSSCYDEKSPYQKESGQTW